MLFWVFAFCSLAIHALYEDGIGQLDWHRSQIGHVIRADFANSGDNVYVASEAGVLASLSSSNGKHLWRRILPEGSIDLLVTRGGQLLTFSANERSAAWRMWNGDGSFYWEIAFPSTVNHYTHASAVFIEGQGKESDLCLLSQNTIRYFRSFSSQTSEPEWTWSPPNGIDLRVLSFFTSIQIIGYDAATQTLNGYILNQDGSLKDTTEVKNAPDGPYLTMEEGHILVLNAPNKGLAHFSPGSKPERIDLVGITGGVLSLADSNKLRLSALSASSFIVASASKHFVFHVSKSKSIVFFKALQIESGAVTCGTESHISTISISKDVLKINEHSDSLLKANVQIGEDRGPLDQCFLHVSSSTDYRVLVTGKDHSITLIQSGKLMWAREEALAATLEAQFFDLPADSLFSAADSRGYPSFFERLGPQLEYLTSLLQMSASTNVIHEARFFDDTQREDVATLRMDQFGFRKLLVAVTRCGKVFALNTATGNIVWTHRLQTSDNLSNLRLFNLGLHKALVLAEGISSDGNPRTSVFYFNPVSGQFTRIETLPFALASVVQLPLTNEISEPILVVVGTDQQVSVLPNTPEAHELVRNHRSKIFFHAVHAGSVLGYHLVVKNDKLTSENQWSISFPVGIESVAAVSPPRQDVIHTSIRPVGNGDTYMTKYLNPNMMVIATVRGEPPVGAQTVPSVKRTNDPSVNVYLIDTVTGSILDKTVQVNAEGPVHVIHSENIVVYHYLNNANYRYEISVMELFEDMDSSKDKKAVASELDPNAQVFNSFTALPPYTLQQSYVFNAGISALGVSSSRRGITPKEILVGLKSNQLMGIKKSWLDPRRPYEELTDHDKQEMLFPYMRDLPVDPKNILSYNLTIASLHSVVTSPTLLESTSLVFAFGLDFFFTRITPAEEFDRLSPDFNKPFLIATVSLVLAATFLFRRLAQQAKLASAWK